MTSKPNRPLSQDLTGYEILLGVCGGIAAYKVCEVVSRLVQRGAGVTVAMTEAAREFIGPVTFQALAGRRVLTSLWTFEEGREVRHIEETGAADLMLIAPATANMIGKAANGIADDLVSTLVITTTPLMLFAPAMNHRMWSNPIVQQNVAFLRERGREFIDPGEGWLACKEFGAGRMAEPSEILDRVAALLETKAPRARGGAQ